LIKASSTDKQNWPILIPLPWGQFNGYINMSALENYVYNSFATAISSWSPGLASTIYALSFYLDDEEDDSRYCTVTLSYNTYQQWQTSTPQRPDDSTNRWPVASDSDEAKWNYAFWLQNREVVIASSDEPPDKIGVELRKTWLNELYLGYSDEAAESDFDAAMVKADQIDQLFSALCVRVAQQLHADGIIRHTFGRDIPILVHRLGYSDEIASQTRLANPPGITQEFEAWIAAM
jgi:hypothetical protein